MPASPAMRTALAEADQAIAAATAGITEDEHGAVIRVRTQTPADTSAHSTFVGIFPPGDAERIAKAIAADLFGTAYKPAGMAWEIVWGELGRYLGSADVARRTGLAPSTISTYYAAGKMPPPDVMVSRVPGWLMATIDDWAATLPGRGYRSDLKKA